MVWPRNSVMASRRPGRASTRKPCRGPARRRASSRRAAYGDERRTDRRRHHRRGAQQDREHAEHAGGPTTPSSAAHSPGPTTAPRASMVAKAALAEMRPAADADEKKKKKKKNVVLLRMGGDHVVEQLTFRVPDNHALVRLCQRHGVAIALLCLVIRHSVYQIEQRWRCCHPLWNFNAGNFCTHMQVEEPDTMHAIGREARDPLSKTGVRSPGLSRCSNRLRSLNPSISAHGSLGASCRGSGRSSALFQGRGQRVRHSTHRGCVVG